MILVDTHTHLYDDRLMADEGSIPGAIAAGVQRMYMPNCNSETVKGMLTLAERWPDNCLPMMGLHPCYVKDDYRNELNILAGWMEKRKFAAIGEIGLDYYWDLTWKTQQLEAFREQIDLALKYALPIVIHSRESTQDCIDVVREKQNGTLRGVFHCFSGTIEEAKQIVDLGFYLGIGGVVTYKKSTLPDIVREIPLEHIVLETDAPYLAPVPYRGKRNESAYIPLIAVTIAEVKGMSLTEVAAVTTTNANKLFGYQG